MRLTLGRYLIRYGKVIPLHGHLQLTTLSLCYLSLPHFAPSLLPENIRTYIVQGWYAFSDYAIAHWLDHLEDTMAAIRTRTEKDATLELSALAREIGPFLQLQFPDTDETTVPASFNKRFNSFEPFQSYDFVSHLSQAAYAWSRGLSKLDKNRSENSAARPMGLETIISLLRGGLDSLAQSGMELKGLHRYHGQNLFKCTSAHCRFFYEGFETNKGKISHQNKHQNAYSCTFDGCPRSVLGFPSSRALAAHVHTAHDAREPIRTESPSFPVIEDPESIDIHAAAKEGNLAQVQRWAEQFKGNIPSQKLGLNGSPHGAKFGYISKDSPLLLALRNHSYDAFKFLLENAIPDSDPVLQILNWVSQSDPQPEHFDFILSLPIKIINNKKPVTLMRYGAISRNEELALRLLKWQEGKWKGPSGRPPSSLLNLMASHGFAKCIRFLLEEGGLDPNAVEKKSKLTALMNAAEFGHTSCVSTLLSDKRCKAETVNYQHKDVSAGSLSACNGHEPILRLLTPYLADGGKELFNIAALRQASIQGEASTVQRLLEIEGLDVDLPDRHLYTPFLHAIENGHVAIVRIFLSSGNGRIDINRKCLAHHRSIQAARDMVKNSGASGLILAVVSGYQEVAELILQSEQVDVDAYCFLNFPMPTTTQYTAMRIAQQLKFTGIVKLFEMYTPST